MNERMLVQVGWQQGVGQSVLKQQEEQVEQMEQMEEVEESVSL